MVQCMAVSLSWRGDPTIGSVPGVASGAERRGNSLGLTTVPMILVFLVESLVVNQTPHMRGLRQMSNEPSNEREIRVKLG
jgi:hypothetical protein